MGSSGVTEPKNNDEKGKNNKPKDITEPKKEIIKIEYPVEKMNINIDEIQKHLLRETRDNYFNKLMKFENDLLNGKLLDSHKEYNQVLQGGDLKFDLKDIGIQNDSNDKNNLKETIIKNEETEKVMEKKIINEIEKIKKDNEQHKIKHLKIVLVGINGIGKTTLTNYIFELDERNPNKLKSEKHVNYEIYSKEGFPIKIIEFKGIGHDENNKVETITKEANKYINEQKEKNKDYNEYVHCIWYLISGVRFSTIEDEFLVKLRKAYQDLTIPIILVYNLLSKESSEKMQKYIKGNKNCEGMTFIEVSPKENTEIRANKALISFGRENLIKTTLLKCSQSLKGDMITLMIKEISEFVCGRTLEINREIEKDIIKNAENEINNYKTVLSDEELKNYVVKLFEDSIYHFYEGYNSNLSNESISLLNKSNIIQSIDSFIQYYKPEFEKIINSKLDEIAKTLINEQASIEKKEDNMKVDLKRNIKKFKETTTVYFKRNYYFISQKYILKEINNIVLKKFIECYRLKLDNIVKTLLENNNNNNININLQNCFLEKLKKFALENKINIDIKLINSSRNIDNNEDFDNKENLKEPPPLLKRNNSIDIINQFNIDPNDYNENNDEPQPKEEVNWFIYKKNKWKYLNKETETSLKKFLENNMIYQETYFKQINNENDKIFKMMKEYEKKQLVNFFNKHYKAFIKDKICKVYNSKNLLVDRTIISDIISGQIFEEIYLYKLNISKPNIFLKLY